MNLYEILFWTAFAFAFYAYAGYPLLMAGMAKLRAKPIASGACDASISFVMSVYNEADRLGSRLQELAVLLEQTGCDAEIIVVSDGSTDETVEVAEQHALGGVRVIELERNLGKAAALSIGCAEANHEILVFGDVRQEWSADAFEKLLRNFADPRVGAVSGELILKDSAGVVAGVGAYWRFEKWLRRKESAVDSMPGVTGAICAVRRELFQPIPAGIILDDVYWPLQVVMQGFRVIHEKEAKAFDRLPEKSRDEFKRKVRTLSGNFQLLLRLPGAALPWRNRIWFQFLSHKILRLIAPWALLVMLASCALLPGWFYRTLLAAQGLVYLVGVLAVATPMGKRWRPASAVGSFLVLNAAAWLAFFVWITGRSSRSWRKVHYQLPAPKSEMQTNRAAHEVSGPEPRTTESRTTEPRTK